MLTIRKQTTNKTPIFLALSIGLLYLFFLLFGFLTPSTHAASGVNEQINFQGRLLNIQGATVPDGNYNVEFKIYQDGTGDAEGNPSGTLLWTEDYLNSASNGVLVRNGYISVQLGSVTPFGSSIDWDQDTLWISINIGSTGTSCTPFTSCSPDGEMLPMKRLSATPYSLNSARLNGLTADQFLQVGQGVQNDPSTNTASIHINKTGTGDLLRLQSAGTDEFLVNNSGNIVFGSATSHSIQVAAAAANTVGSGLTIAAGAGGSGTGATGGTLTLQGGAAGGTNGNGGNIVINGGAATGTGTNGTISIGTGTTSAITIGNTNANTLTKIQGGTGTNGINIGNEGSSTTPIRLFGSTTVATQGTNQADAFNVQNASGNKVLNVDTTNSTVSVGNAGTNSGSVRFYSAGGSTYAGIGVGTAPNSSYTLLLPTTAPAGGLCMKSGAENPNQLTFGNCLTPSTPQFVQQVTASTGSNTSTLSATIQNAGNGNLLVAQIATSTSSNVVSSVTDSGGNTWTQAVTRSSSGGTTISIWYCADVYPTSSVTVTLSSASRIAMHISEFDGVAKVSALDVSGGNSNVTGTSYNTSIITTNVANDLIIGGVAWVTGPSMAAESDGWNDFSSVTGNSSLRNLNSRYTVGATVDTYDTSWTTSWYTTGATAIAAFKPIGDSGGSDYAEMYGTSDASIEAGDVVALDATRSAERITNEYGQDDSKAWIKKASQSNPYSLLGIVSTAPGQLIGDTYTNADNPRPVALSGRVPVKVSAENGNISAGDYLTISSESGVAMKATAAGMTIGQALSGYSGSGTGTVTVFVNTTYFPGTVDGNTLSLGSNTTPEDATIAIDGEDSEDVSSGATDSVLQPTSDGNVETGGESVPGSAVQGQEASSLFTTDMDNSSISLGDGTATLAGSGLGDLFIAGNLEVRTALRIGDGVNGINIIVGQAPSSESGFYLGSNRPTRTISLAPTFTGLTTTGEQNGTLTSGFDTNPGNPHSYYEWTTDSAVDQTVTMYVRVSVPRDWSSFTANPSICYNVWSSSISQTSAKATFYDTAGGAQAASAINPSNNGAWKEVCSRNVGGTIEVNGSSFITLKVDLTASAGSSVKLGEFSLDYLSAF